LYLGDELSTWQEYDATMLISSASSKLPLPPIMIEQGSSDDFLQEQLMPETFKAAADKANHKLTLRMQKDYDHSYFFIASFIEEHLRFHFKHLNS
jgi:S-formylglutathione hydrolase